MSDAKRAALFSPRGAPLLVDELQRLTLRIQFRSIFSKSLPPPAPPDGGPEHERGQGPPSPTLSRLMRTLASARIATSQLTAMSKRRGGHGIDGGGGGGGGSGGGSAAGSAAASVDGQQREHQRWSKRETTARHSFMSFTRLFTNRRRIHLKLTAKMQRNFAPTGRTRDGVKSGALVLAAAPWRWLRRGVRGVGEGGERAHAGSEGGSDEMERQAIIQDVVERSVSSGKRWERLTVEEVIGPTVLPSVFEPTTHGFTQRLI